LYYRATGLLRKGEPSINAETIRELLHRQPFEPFDLIMSNGERYQVRHPEFAMLVHRTVVIGYPDSDRISICSLAHVASVERPEVAA